MSNLYIKEEIAITPDGILKLSSSQNATCMYSTEELATFPQEKLQAICAGIAALDDRRPWRRLRSLREFIGKGRWRRKKAKVA
ncbi:MAG: hypothetical protein WC998_04360 [Candidatus Paceibacterota bacterium]|jgi:hypothetical protein